jgi:hypothetical protein
VYEIPPVPGTPYRGWVDPSGGRHDSFALSIAHNENGRLILDVCRARRPPFDPASVVAEYAEVLKSYGLTRVTGDRYGAEFVVSAFRSQGIHYDPSPRSASEVYLEILPYFAQGVIQLLDNRTLLNELRQLERRTGQTKDSVTHPLRGHDDAACAACGALLMSVRGVALDLRNQAFVPSAGERQQARDEHLLELDWAGDLDDDSPTSFEKGGSPW